MNFAVSITSQKIFNENDTNSEIIKASYTFGYTIILKQENYDTLRSTSYRNTLKQLNTQNEALTKTVEQLKETNKQILRQKKQFREVVFLFIAVIVCGIGIYYLNDNLKNTQDELNSANDTIDKKDTLISAQKDNISVLNDWVESLNFKLDQERIKNTELSSKLNKIAKYYPFIVTSYDINTYRLFFEYLCTKDTEITITLMAINISKVEVISNDYTLTFSKGEGSKSLDFNGTLDTRCYYYVVLLYNGQIIAGKYW
jgi:cell division protein FtsL